MGVAAGAGLNSPRRAVAAPPEIQSALVARSGTVAMANGVHASTESTKAITTAQARTSVRITKAAAARGKALAAAKGALTVWVRLE